MSGGYDASQLQAAAWVPWDPDTSWDDAADLAAEWIWERSAVEGVEPLLVTNTLRGGAFTPALEDIARCAHVSPRSRNQRFEHRPVLAYVPDQRALSLAVKLARGHSLAIVEGSFFRLDEWAAGVGAFNLLTGDATTTALAHEVLKDLDSAILFGGNNGWSGPHEKDHARIRLSPHVAGGQLTADQPASYVMSRGVHDRGAMRLKSLLDPNGRR